MATQWHPLFAELLRPLLEGYYEVQTNVPVGDVPREADLVLLRRTTSTALPFRGLWRHLKTWNIMEYKGPSVSARLDDIDLLIELGLGIHRRLSAEQAKLKQAPVPASQVSFWYLANHLGRRFRRQVAEKLGALDALGEGIWRSQILDREVFLISGTDVLVEPDSVPLHILALESPEKELEVAQLVVQDQSLCQLYSQFLGTLHPETLRELQVMPRTAKKELKFHLKPFIDFVGLKEVIDQVGLKRVVAALDKKKLLSHLLSELSPAERADLKRSLERKRS